ncbi:MAG: septal ring lytic transglycosylase RlpA family protein [Proteobacteria bacterium]|nr:septal ring lytic transglycosylase RlpA family protein [Candidatus Enterousia scatequi]
MKKIVSMAVLTALLAGCAGTTGTQDATKYGADNFSEETLITADGATLNDSYLLAPGPKYYIGNAYKVEDVQYIPAEDMSYNQTGMAGIIPNELNGTKTSNGEIFNSDQMLATSKTLPLPTIARVTNTENGQSVVVRINNRGPFVNTRVLDLSAAAAKKLGITSTAKVQVQVLPEQSMAVKSATIGEVQPAKQTEPVATTSGEYSVQLAAFYSEDSANDLATQMSKYGKTVVSNEGGLYKVRIVDLDAAAARSTIDALRTSEGLAPGLLKSGRWINADSI